MERDCIWFDNTFKKQQCARSSGATSMKHIRHYPRFFSPLPPSLSNWFSLATQTFILHHLLVSILFCCLTGIKLASAGLERLVLKDAERETHSDGWVNYSIVKRRKRRTKKEIKKGDKKERNNERKKRMVWHLVRRNKHVLRIFWVHSWECQPEVTSM